jgi:putative thioredoxin
MNAATPNVVDVTERTFEAEVIDYSKKIPVVVDFWAPWCGPCRVIGPVLERMANESRGAFRLAKVNTDESPTLAEAFGITGIPLVMAFRGGRVVNEFTGALPEASIREFLAGILPNEAERLAADGETKRAGGRFDEAETLFRQALEADRDQPVALLGLARIAADKGRDAEVFGLVDQIPPGPERDEGDRLAAQVRVRAAGGVDIEGLRARVTATPDDLASRLALAKALSATGAYEEALEHYLDIVRRDRAFEDDAGRRGMLDLFEILGHEHPLTTRYRSALGQILFA